MVTRVATQPSPGARCKVHTRDVEGDRLRVLGKGGRVRLIPLHPTLLAEISQAPAGWLFPGFTDGHLAPHTVSKNLSALLPGCSAHQLRHRFASLCYAADRDIRAVQELLGHASVSTTQVYTAVPSGALMSAVLAAGR